MRAVPYPTRLRLAGWLALLLALLPLVFLVVLSFGRGWSWPLVLPEGYGVAPWREGLGGSGALGLSLLRSLVIAVSVASVSTALACWTARVLTRSSFGDSLLQLAYLPYVFPPVILAAALQYFFLRAGLTGTLSGVLLAQLLIVYPFATILSFGFWNPRTLALEDTARTLGAHGRQLWRRVLWPLVRGGVAVVFVQAFLVSWFEYGLTLTIGVGKVVTLPLRVFQYVGEANPYFAAVASLLIVGPPVALLLVNRRFLIATR